MWRLISRMIIPITIISFFSLTKWWHAQPVDAPDTMYTGFPLIYQGTGWATSLSLQIFILEYIFDVLVYFLFWVIVITTIDHFIFKIKLYRPITITLWIMCSLMIILTVMIDINPDNNYYLKRPYDIKILESGYRFF